MSLYGLRVIFLDGLQTSPPRFRSGPDNNNLGLIIIIHPPHYISDVIRDVISSILSV